MEQPGGSSPEPDPVTKTSSLAQSSGVEGVEARSSSCVEEAIDNLGSSLKSSLDNIDARLARLEEQLVMTGKGSASPVSRSASMIKQSITMSTPMASRKHSRAGLEVERTSSAIGSGSMMVHADKSVKVFAPLPRWQDETLMEALDNPYEPHHMMAQTSSVGSYLGESPFRVVVPTGKCVIRPSSIQRLSWDMLGLVLILYDVIMIPVQLAFEPEFNPFTLTMQWLSIIFWTLDIPASFCTGYYLKGVEELGHRNIAKKYLSTWFSLDLIVVTIDWIIVFSAIGLDAVPLARAGKTLRILRVLRSLRMLRVAKLRKLYNHVQDHITSNYLQILLYMLKLIILIIFMNHFIACAFYGLSVNLDGLYERTWVEATIQEGGESNHVYLYLTSLHWSMSQFTPASMEVTARNAPERAFTVMVLMFALMVFSSFLSSITAAMTKLRDMTAIFDKDVSVMRRYLLSDGVSHDLSVRILRFVEHQTQVQMQGIQEKDVKLLDVLSKPLREELVQENRSPKLCVHPFFKHFAHVDTGAMKQVCNVAVESCSFMEGDVIFSEGAIAERMYILLEGGNMTYELKRTTQNRSMTRRFIVRSSTSMKDGLENDESLVRREDDHIPDWCSEAALWTNWVHLGTMQALTFSGVLTVDGKLLQSVILKHHPTMAGTMLYLHAWVDRLNRQASGLFMGQVAAPLSDVPGISADGTTEREELDEIASRAFAMSPPRRNSRRLSTRSMGAWFGSENSNDAEKERADGGSMSRRMSERSPTVELAMGPTSTVGVASSSTDPVAHFEKVVAAL